MTASVLGNVRVAATSGPVLSALACSAALNIPCTPQSEKEISEEEEGQNLRLAVQFTSVAA
jgi:hypothetical protein